MATRVNYESTEAPPVMDTIAAGSLGKRNEAGLAAAFDGPSEGTRHGAPRNTNDNRLQLISIAREKMAEYDGGNQMFPQYRRNFVPAPDGPEYVAVRDKNTVSVGVGTGLGSAYSPTIASPGAQNGINPTTLASISSSINGAVIDVLDNPSIAVHQNVGDAITGRTGERVGETGQVRRFRLAVGSGGAAPTNNSIATSVGQFPRPLT
jgi:hypothetical protein